MSFYGSFLSDEQFQCSICLEVFTNPSSTPCGHSFCMSCISRYWDGSKTCQCPLCKKTFQKRPDLQINRTLREITEQFRSMQGGLIGGGRATGRVKRVGKTGGGRNDGMHDDLMLELAGRLPKPLPQRQVTLTREAPTSVNPTPGQVSHTASLASSVPNNSPIATYNPAVELLQPPPLTASLASSVPNDSPIATYNPAVEPPQPPPPYNRSNGRRRFTLSCAASSQSLPVCAVHQRGLLIYCRDDRVCICPDCETESHQGHDTVTVEDEYSENKVKLRVCEQQVQEMIGHRLQKIDDIQLSVNEMESAVEREITSSICIFSALVSAIERSQAELMEVMETSQRAVEQQASAIKQQLELEIEELRRRERMISDLAQSEDYIHCVENFPIVSSPPPTKDWSGVSMNFNMGTDNIYRTLADLMERYQEQLRSLAETGLLPMPSYQPPDSSPSRTQPKVKRVQEYALDVTLDCNSAHPRLIVSGDMKSVKCVDRNQLLPDNIERFDRVVCVLGSQAISAGRHYWEVLVGGKTDWDLGVARQSINRKGKINVNPSNGYWFLSLRDKSKYAFRTEPSTDIDMNLRPHKIGIFVDYENGQVSFYNVDARVHIYTFNDTFTECIFPFFSPCTNKSGKNDGPLVITPVILTA
ncbi:zinc finger protein RFP [Neosynchiropus ocellatus]